MVSLQLISATSAYLLLPSQVVSICDLQRLALYWFHAPGLQLDNEVHSQRTSHMEVHKVLTLTAKKRDQRGLQNSDKNKLVEIKVKLEAN